MNTLLHSQADTIIRSALSAVHPARGMQRALAGFQPPAGRLILIAAGKAAWTMAEAALPMLPPPDAGLIVTKYGHSRGPLPGMEIRETGHPLPDNSSCAAGLRALELVQGLTEDDTVLLLLSGGASALFELPRIPLAELEDVTSQLLSCGAGIGEINTVRAAFSSLKGGRFGAACAPARVVSVLLSDVGDASPDYIGGGPAAQKAPKKGEARRIALKYGLRLSHSALALLEEDPPALAVVPEQIVIGSVRDLIRSAAEACRRLGYETIVLPELLSGEASVTGEWMGRLGRYYSEMPFPRAFIAGGETVVHVTGSGKGGRNQELALAAAPYLRGCSAAVFSLGSDGSDGPTEAAGGYADGDTAEHLEAQGGSAGRFLRDNNSYYALARTRGLIFTGPTGTNVNDVAVLLCRPKE